MVPRHRRRPVDPDSPVVDLDRVLADDSWIDEIGRGGPASSDGAATRSAGAHRGSGRHRRGIQGEPLRELLDEWRTELSHRPLPPSPVLTLPATAPTRSPRPRSRRPMLAIAAAIGAVIVGTASIGAANATPDSPFWPITRALLPDRAESADAVRSSLDRARTALDSGRTGEAQAALWRAADELRRLPEGDEHDAMQQTIVALWVAATPPSGSTSDAARPRPAGVSAPANGPAPVSAPGSANASPSAGVAAPPPPVLIEAMAASGHPPAGQQPTVLGQSSPVGSTKPAPAPTDGQTAGGSSGGSVAASVPVAASALPTPHRSPPPTVTSGDPETSGSSETTGSPHPVPRSNRRPARPRPRRAPRPAGLHPIRLDRTTWTRRHRSRSLRPASTRTRHRWSRPRRVSEACRANHRHGADAERDDRACEVSSEGRRHERGLPSESSARCRRRAGRPSLRGVRRMPRWLSRSAGSP